MRRSSTVRTTSSRTRRSAPNYDAWLDLDVRSRGKAKVRRALLTGSIRRTRELRWDSSSKGAALLAAFVLLLVGAAATLPGTSRFRLQPASAAATGCPGMAVDLDDAGVRKQVRLRDSTPRPTMPRIRERAVLRGSARPGQRDPRGNVHRVRRRLSRVEPVGGRRAVSPDLFQRCGRPPAPSQRARARQGRSTRPG